MATIKGIEVDENYEYAFEKKKLIAYLGKTLYNELKASNAIIAGGMITSIFTNSEINDIDVYFRSNKDVYEYAEANLGFIISHTDKATQYVKKNNDKELLVQLIHYRSYDNPLDIFKTFDYTVCMGAYDFETEEFVLHKDFLKHNSQRLLRFNSNTSFPIISAIRSDKYKDKGYTISKSEYIRVILTCMNLNITSYDELKEQLGGMYGVSYDRLFEDVSEEDFDLATAIDMISNINMTDEYFEEWKPTDITLEEVLEDINKCTYQYVVINGEDYKIKDDKLIKYNKKKIDERLDSNEYFKGLKFYKSVKKVNGKYFSYYDESFEYKLGEVVKAENEYDESRYDKEGLLFFNYKDTLHDSNYYERGDAVVVEVELNVEDLVSINDKTITATKCSVIREVNKLEYVNLNSKSPSLFWQR